MGVEILEKRFQHYRQQHPHNIPRLRELAEKSRSVQQQVRAILDELTPQLCVACTASCCKCMPIDGWFTESDYFLYRLLYDEPAGLRRMHADGRSCTFLGSRGCVLPGDMRSFPCVKVNCKTITTALAEKGRLEEFSACFDALTAIQEAVWPLLNGYLSENVVQAQQL
jgi:hypothetical protein